MEARPSRPILARAFLATTAASVFAATGALGWTVRPSRVADPHPGARSATILAAPKRATGRIEGLVEISSALTARRPQFRPYSDPGSGALPPPPPKDATTAEVKNVVVYLDGDSSTFPGLTDEIARGRKGSIAQRDERFVPHVLAVMQGATVDFPNQDDVYHNVFSLSSAAGPSGFDLGRYPKGASRSWTFNKAGTVQVFCHIHSDMSATLLVLSNPFFASPDDTHHYAIVDVPEGDYTIVGWHERIKPITRRIHVTAGQTTTANFNIPLPQGGPR